MAEPPYWLVWREGGPGPTYRHPDVVSAENEAKRLARANPGQAFVILCPLSRITCSQFVVETFDPTDDGIPF